MLIPPLGLHDLSLDHFKNTKQTLHMETKYFYTDLYTYSAEPAKTGLEKAIVEAMRYDVTDIVVCVSQLSSLDGTFSEAFGEDLADKLKRKGFIRYQGMSFYLSTKRKKTPRLSKFVVFGLEITPEDIEYFSRDKNVVALVYMPLHEAELDTFRNRFRGALYVRTTQRDQ